VSRRKPCPLTSRQLEVVRLVSEGLTYQEIAQELVVTRRTVIEHMEKVKRNLGLYRTSQPLIVAMAVRNRWIP
jgi:DNA-binding NarL/FixJ family response regulator